MVPKFLEAEVEAVGVVLLFGVYYFSIKEREVDPKDTRANRREKLSTRALNTQTRQFSHVYC